MKKDIYKKLETNMVRISDLINITVKENNEKFITLSDAIIPSGYKTGMSDMEQILGKQIWVRESVHKRLKKAQANLQIYNPNLSLYVTYGYRTLEIQTRKFLKQLKKINTYFGSSIALYEEIHRYIAVPTVAGHPTGGAIDIIIIDKRMNNPINFGSKQYSFTTKNCYTFYPYISANAKKNRMLLRTVMTKAGFAPFDGEWWHFSYGDREWAFYYKKGEAIYEQKYYKELKKAV